MSCRPTAMASGRSRCSTSSRIFRLGEYPQDSVQAFHLKIEAQKLATQDLKRYVADPRVASVPTQGLLSKTYAKQRAASDQQDKANCDVQPGTPEGHAGADNLPERGGQGRQHRFVDPEHLEFLRLGNPGGRHGISAARPRRRIRFRIPITPTRSAPRKRPYHTIIPGFMENGDQHIGFGIMRGMNQPQAQMQLVTNIVDHKMNIQYALEAPRFTKSTLGGCDLADGVASFRTSPRRARQAGTSRERCRRILRLHGRRAGGAARLGGQAELRRHRRRAKTAPRFRNPIPISNSRGFYLLFGGSGAAGESAPRPAIGPRAPPACSPLP